MERGVIVAPLRIKKNKRGDLWSINLNQYRNTHYQSLNKLKKEYKEFLRSQIEQLNPFSRVRLSFHVYAADNRKFDLGNVTAIHEKFFLDALVELGKLPDDNIDYCPECHTYFMGVDKDLPRVEIIVEELISVSDQ